LRNHKKRVNEIAENHTKKGFLVVYKKERVREKGKEASHQGSKTTSGAGKKGNPKEKKELARDR